MSRRSPSGASPWSGVSYAILVIFVSLFFILGVSYRRPHLDFSWGKKKYDFPDFDRITLSRTLVPQQIDFDSNDRIIIIGDVHGMNHSLADLLSQLSYDQSGDILLFAGDLLAKSTHAGSLSVLDFLVQNQYHTSPSSSNQTQRIFAVRGNHDQLIVQWRSWREWFEQLTIAPSSSSKNQEDVVTTGKDFLDLVEAEWDRERRRREADAEEWVDVARKRAVGTWREEWWRRIPPPGQGKKAKDWKIFGDHYWLARDMTTQQAAFLNSLPLVHHVPHLHFFVAHAGLLPYNPRLAMDDPTQPLARPPRYVHLPSSNQGSPEHADSDDDDEKKEEIDFAPDVQQDILERRDISSDLREQQESSILSDIKQNRDPWVILNMRGVKKNGKVTRDNDEGTPWSKLWNQQMKQCGGIPAGVVSTLQGEDGNEEQSFPCEPSTVVYGHAASRGLDVKRWSMGLDTGCLYGQRLTALVLRPGRGNQSGHDAPGEEKDEEDSCMVVGDDDDDDQRRNKSRYPPKKRLGRRQPNHRVPRKVKFGDSDMGLDARIVQVKCSLPSADDPHNH